MQFGITRVLFLAAMGITVQVAPAGEPTAVLILAPSANNPRNSEGDFVQLRDSRLLLVFTRFTGGAADNDAAALAGRFSSDGGRTWSEQDLPIVPADPGVSNAMSVSLLRLQDGRIAIFYLLKRSPEDCRPVMRVSSDEAATWSEPRVVIPEAHRGYYVLNNDRVVQLAGRSGAVGRLVVPVALHRPGGGAWSSDGTIMCYLSDDAGRSWRRSQAQLREPGTLQEPGIVELRNGRLMMFCRTLLGSQYVAYSNDGGETWSEPEASALVSPRSPASIERIPGTGDLLAVWNDHYDKSHPGGGRRTPLCTAISKDEGRTWTHHQTLEANPHGWFCYTAIEFVGDHVLLAYCAGDRRENNGLALTKVVRLPVSLFYRPPGASRSSD